MQSRYDKKMNDLFISLRTEEKFRTILGKNSDVENLHALLSSAEQNQFKDMLLLHHRGLILCKEFADLVLIVESQFDFIIRTHLRLLENALPDRLIKHLLQSIDCALKDSLAAIEQAHVIKSSIDEIKQNNALFCERLPLLCFGGKFSILNRDFIARLVRMLQIKDKEIHAGFIQWSWQDRNASNKRKRTAKHFRSLLDLDIDLALKVIEEEDEDKSP